LKAEENFVAEGKPFCKGRPVTNLEVKIPISIQVEKCTEKKEERKVLEKGERDC
jgi:hypothetical protein